MVEGCKCLHCGWGCIFPDKRTYVTCLRCGQLTVYKNEKQYLEFIRKQPVYVPVSEPAKCRCGCGQDMPDFTSGGNIRQYICGHENVGENNSGFKDMTGIRCSLCDSEKTYYQKQKMGKRPHWNYNINNYPICEKCRCKEYYKDNRDKMLKQVREHYRKKRNIPPERYRV